MNSLHNTVSSGSTRGGVRVALQLEGAAIAALATLAFAQTGVSWAWFAALLLLPDLSMLGYAAGDKIGALIYNLAHSYTGAIGVLLVHLAVGGAGKWGIALVCIWVAHIGMDRAIGYGLKYARGFKSTHLMAK